MCRRRPLPYQQLRIKIYLYSDLQMCIFKKAVAGCFQLRNLAADRSFGYCWWFGLLVEYWRQIERKMKVVFFCSSYVFIYIYISLQFITQSSNVDFGTTTTTKQ
jgi:hypothetical protein